MTRVTNMAVVMSSALPLVVLAFAILLVTAATIVMPSSRQLAMRKLIGELTSAMRTIRGTVGDSARNDVGA